MECSVRGFLFNRFYWLVFFGAVAGCAGTLVDPDRPEIEFESSSNEVSSKIEYKQHGGQIAVGKDEKSRFSVQWMACLPEQAKKSVFLVHREEAAFSEKKFCRSWQAQAFMKSQFNVLAINRPGFGKSTGAFDFTGTKSIEAVATFLKKPPKELSKITPPEAAWGYASGALSCARLAKNLTEGSWKSLILGGGLYSLEEIRQTSTSDGIKNLLARLEKTPGRSLEDDSISYDFEGLPKQIFMYHGEKDEAVPIGQADQFRQTLETQEYQVQLMVLKSMGHLIPWQDHAVLLQQLAKKIAK